MRDSDAKAARPGSYGSETVTSVRAGERLEQRPLGAGQVLEAVGEDRRAVPGVEVASEALDGFPPDAVPIAQAEARQLVAVRVDELRELAVEPTRIDERGLELADRLEQGVREARRRGRRA